MPRPPPQPLAFALVVAHFISQLRIAQRSQRIRRNKLPFPRREPLRIPCPSIVPLVRDAARLVDSRREHSLHISFGRRQSLPQVNLSPLRRRQRNQLPVLAHVNSSNPSRFPIPRFQQPSRSRILCHVHGLLHRIRILILLSLSRRIWSFLRRRLTRCTRLRRLRLALFGLLLARLVALRPHPAPPRYHQKAQHHEYAARPAHP